MITAMRVAARRAATDSAPRPGAREQHVARRAGQPRCDRGGAHGRARMARSSASAGRALRAPPRDGTSRAPSCDRAPSARRRAMRCAARGDVAVRVAFQARGTCSGIGPSLNRCSSARPSRCGARRGPRPQRGERAPAAAARPAEGASADRRDGHGNRADRTLPAARSNRRGARGRQPTPSHRAPAALRRASGLSGGARPGP